MNTIHKVYLNIASEGDRTHRSPRFVEDVVREMLRNTAEFFPDLPDDAFVLARQVNFEGIHKHDALAERYGLLGDIRRELGGGNAAPRHTGLHEWLRGEAWTPDGSAGIPDLRRA